MARVCCVPLWGRDHALPEDGIESKYKGNEHRGCNGT